MTADTGILSSLRQDGKRITQARRAVAAIFTDSRKPLCAADVLAELRTRKVSANPTTVYRELKFLEETGILSTVHFKDGVTRYERADLPHHHHLVCTSCHDVADVHMESDLHAVEKKIAATKGFAVREHALEFYGTCRRCR